MLFEGGLIGPNSKAGALSVMSAMGGKRTYMRVPLLAQPRHCDEEKADARKKATANNPRPFVDHEA